MWKKGIVVNMISLYDNFKDVLEMTWPMLFISLVLLVSVRISYLIKHNVKFVFYKEVMLLLFILYILCLFQVVTVQDINTSGGNNFVPFMEIFRYKPWGRLFIKNIVGNVIMFMPYGFFIGEYATGKNFLFSLFLLVLASFSIECTQLAIGRVFDVDDIILNVFGGILGYIVYLFTRKIYDILPKPLKQPMFLNIVTFVFLCLVIVFIIFLIV